MNTWFSLPEGEVCLERATRYSLVMNTWFSGTLNPVFITNNLFIAPDRLRLQAKESCSLWGGMA
jgi:hypothetical protein